MPIPAPVDVASPKKASNLGSHALILASLAQDRTEASARRICPHCTGTRIQRWGQQSGRVRFRCSSCERTHSETTGTFAFRLRKLDRLPRVLEAMANSQSIRETARTANISVGTAFVWRHRILRAAIQPNQEARISREGCIMLRRVPSNRKGNRGSEEPVRVPNLHPTTRRSPLNQENKFDWIVGAQLDRPARFQSKLRLEIIPIQPFLPPRILFREMLERLAKSASKLRIRGLGAPWMNLEHARREGSSPRKTPRNSSRGFHRLDERLRAFRVWMRGFRGVASHYLESYLIWFRMLLGGSSRVDRGFFRSGPSGRTQWTLIQRVRRIVAALTKMNPQR